MKRTIAALLTVGLFYIPSLGAQSRDSALAVRIKADFDSIARDRTQPQYSKRAVVRGKARADSIIALHLTPVPPVDSVIVPTPIDSLPTCSGIAECPRVYIRDAYPTALRVVRVPASQSLQAALDTARAGDEIQLAQGTVYAGTLTWRRCLAGIVTITTQGIALPEGSRVTPAVALQFAKLVATGDNAAVQTAPGACGLRLSRVEGTFVASLSVNYNNGIIRIGSGETTLDQQPSGITLDRVYLHGSPTTMTKNGVIANGRRITVVDSWIDDIHWKGVESHCVIAYQGAGPFRLTNNTFRCASIGVLFGGARRSIPGVAPADIEVRGNYFTKDTTWNEVIKNHFELKDASRVLFEGNVLERTWFAAQTGMAFLLQSLTDEGDTTVQVADVTVRFNRIRFANQCFVLSARGYNGVARPLSRVVIANNLCTDVGSDSLSRVATMSGDIHDLQVTHNTFVRNALPIKQQAIIPDTGPATGTVWMDNVYGSGQLYGCVMRSGGATGAVAWLAFDPSVRLGGNVCWNNAGSKTPSTDYFPATMADVGFSSDWSLTTSSQFKGKATDGKDPGADITELTKRTSGVSVP